VGATLDTASGVVVGLNLCATASGASYLTRLGLFVKVARLGD